MAENTLPQTLSTGNGGDLNYVERDGRILFSAHEIGRQLGYRNPSKSVNILFNRNQEELRIYERGIKLMSRDGQAREVRHFTEEGAYILSMLANTPKAREFRANVARLLRGLREARLREAYGEGLHDRRRAAREGAEAVLALPPFQREVLARLRRYAGMGLSCAELARLLGCGETSVKRSLRTARALGLAPQPPVQGSLLETAEEGGRHV